MSNVELPVAVVREDNRLEGAASKASDSLAKHRWHWTLDEANAGRTSIRGYAKAVARGETTIRNQVNGYAAWLAEGARASARTLGEHIERAKMSAEKESLVEAVADANEITFKHAREQYAPDVSRVRDAVERAVERKPDMAADERTEYARRTAQTIARSRAVDATRREEQKQQRSVMFMRIDAKLAHARRDLRDVLDYGRDLGLGEDEVEDVKAALARIKSFTDMIDMALTGSMNVDWDAELAKLGEGA